MRRPARQKVAEHLKTLPSGTVVDVRRDDGTVEQHRTESEPWQLGHGDWVVKLDGISGGYDLARVSIITTGGAR